jgi:Tfp pilus assembly protein PilE
MNLQKNKKALTLIELMILVAMIALISSVVFSKTSVFVSNFQQKQEIQKLISHLNYVEKIARLQKTSLSLDFSIDKGVFCVQDSLFKKNKHFKQLKVSGLAGKVDIYPPEEFFLEKPIRFTLKNEQFEIKHSQKDGFYLSH